jgi:hypothetical protein
LDINLNIEDKELDYIKDFLKGKVNPVDLHDVANKLALFKTRDSRSHRVKMYNPNCEYKSGDLIYKEYPGKIPVGAKKHIEMEKGVVLKVVGVRTRFGKHEIQLKYEGTSDFKKYISYLERQKIELLLPHKFSKPCEKPEFLPEDIDPRKEQAPLEKRDFNALLRKLSGVLNKSPEIALISNKVLLKEHLRKIDDAVFNRIKDFLTETKKSETTEYFVENYVNVEPTDENFNAYCFALNYRMQIDYKIDFQQTQDIGWGKWNLISVIYYLKKDSPISGDNPLLMRMSIANKKNLSQRRKKFEESLFADGASNTRYYLTQREITAGAVRLKPGFYDLGESIEVEIVDSKQKKSYLVYYYKDFCLMLGLKEIFERYKALQGAIITFEMPTVKDDHDIASTKLHFTIRTTKKGTISNIINYNADKKAFEVTEEKIASPVFVNKSMFLDEHIFQTIFEKLDELRKISTLNKLVHKVFLEFGIRERNYEIHILRLYHILDLIYPIDMKVLEEIILGNEEFVPAEKMAGVFYLDSEAVAGIEEEEVKRRETQIDETKKKRDEIRKKKLEQEHRIKEEIRRKREERRKKREEEMWEKERLSRETDERYAPEAIIPTQPVLHNEPHPTPDPSAFSRPESAPKPHRVKEAPVPSKEDVIEEEASRKKEAAQKRTKKKKEEEKPLIKSHKKAERPTTPESLSADELKREIELEKLKDQMRDRKKESEKAAKKEKVAYQDKSGGFGGIFASKLDEVVKKDEQKDEK